MNDDADNEESDPVMRSMRSVWISMRDEEPPSHGLAELLAAAHTKAKQMQPAPWWQRMFAAMVKPPVLAAATVVVLVGGAIVIDRRSDDLSTAQPTIVETRPTPEPKREALKRDETQLATKSGAAVAAVEDPKPEPKKPEEPPPRRTYRPPRGAQGNQTERTRPPDNEGEKLERVEAPETTGPDSGSAGGFGGIVPRQGPPENKPKLEIAGDAEDSGRRAPPPVQRPPVTRDPVSPDAPANQRPSGGSAGRQPNVDQLVRQAEVAASRKDCPAVRVTIARIKKLDPNVYRERVVKQGAIANCLK